MRNKNQATKCYFVKVQNHFTFPEDSSQPKNDFILAIQKVKYKPSKTYTDTNKKKKNILP